MIVWYYMKMRKLETVGEPPKTRSYKSKNFFIKVKLEGNYFFSVVKRASDNKLARGVVLVVVLFNQ